MDVAGSVAVGDGSTVEVNVAGICVCVGMDEGVAGVEVSDSPANLKLPEQFTKNISSHQKRRILDMF